MTDDRILLALLAIGLAILLVAGAAALMLREMAARDLEQRVVSLANGRIDGAALGSPSALGGMHRLLSWIGATVRGRTKLYSDRDLMVLEGMISGTGFNPRTVLPLVLGAKVVLAIGIPLVAILYARFIGLSGGQQFLTLCIAIPLGLLGPDWVLTLLRRPYLAALRRGVPRIGFLTGVDGSKIVRVVTESAFWALAVAMFALAHADGFGAASLVCTPAATIILLWFAYRDVVLDRVIAVAGALP